MKKPLRRAVLNHAIALHGKSFRWVAVSTEYKPLMQISKSTRYALDSHSKMSSECDTTLELYRDFRTSMLGIKMHRETYPKKVGSKTIFTKFKAFNILCYVVYYLYYKKVKKADKT